MSRTGERPRVSDSRPGNRRKTFPANKWRGSAALIPAPAAMTGTQAGTAYGVASAVTDGGREEIGGQRLCGDRRRGWKGARCCRGRGRGRAASAAVRGCSASTDGRGESVDAGRGTAAEAAGGEGSLPVVVGEGGDENKLRRRSKTPCSRPSLGA